MTFDEMFPSRWMKKEDVPNPVVATIRAVTREEVSTEGGKEPKAVLVFAEDHLKPMILNIGNGLSVKELYGGDSAAWVGKKIEIYTDPNVMFGGKRVGGLRLRAPSVGSGAPAPAAAGLWDFSDGTAAHTRKNQTTQQVTDYLDELADSGSPLPVIRVRPAGSRETPVTADVWLAAHAPAVADSGEVPF